MKRTPLLLCCLLFLQTNLYSAELAKDGATGWTIVLPDGATIVEKTASRELSEHLKLVTGANLPTIAEKDVPAGGKSLIFVGNTGKAPKKNYKFDEILIKMDGGNLILAGHEKRGACTRSIRFCKTSSAFAGGAPRYVHPEEADARRGGRPEHFLRAADDLGAKCTIETPSQQSSPPA